MTRNKTNRFLRDQKGSVAILVAGGMAALLGFAVLAVDVGHFYAEQNALQVAADSAALAALSDLPNKAQVKQTVRNYIEKNLPALKHGQVVQDSDIEVGNWDPDTRTFTADLNPLNALQVTVGKTVANGNPEPTMFGKILGMDDVDIVASSIVAAGKLAPCLMALEPVEKEAIKLDAGSTITADGCAVRVNSSSAEAVVNNSGSDLTADAIDIHGDYTGSGFTPEPTIDVPPSPDPLASLLPPPEADDACDHTDLAYENTTVTLSPGVYCKNLKLNANTIATMEPGTYVFRDADFLVNSNSTLTGEGVFMYFTGENSPEFILNSDSHAELSAPTEGPYAGILIYGDRNVEDGTVHLFNSDADSVFIGTIYVPNGRIKINSGTTLSGTAPYTNFIARSFEIDANSGIVLNSDYAATDVPVPAGLATTNSRLVM